MTIEQVKNKCSDCKKTHRWADVRSDFEIGKSTTYRIVGIGRLKVRVMAGNGSVFNVLPAEIKRAW